ncbi:hypothetical protein BDY24DRAFT_403425 [Mrakia frigida]|uniref:uncharacterized protein n=1 Tax=Mrakia frigida TaxID=29902 RepID=UPI003FCC0BE7
MEDTSTVDDTPSSNEIEAIPIPTIVIDKGKGREESTVPSSKEREWGRDELVWEDISELITGDQTKTLVFSSQNVVVASITRPLTLSSSSNSNGILPSPRLQAFPLPTSPSTSSSSPPSSFSLPMPSFPLPHLSPTYLSLSPSASYLLAFFPLSGPPGQGGTLAVWEIAGRGKERSEWEIKDTWAVPGGKEVVDVAWLGAEREWIASSSVAPQDQPVKEEEGAAQSTSTNSARPKFHRLPPLGPPLPSHVSSSTPPTFVILTASHEVVLHHPISSNSAEKRWPLRTLRCGISGPEFGVWGLADGPSVEAAAGTSGGEGGKSGRRVRRGKILVRGEDPSIYLVVQSTILPPPPPPPPPAKEPLSLLTGLGSLDMGIDFDALGGTVPTAVSPSEVAATEGGEDVSGDEPWIEVIECKIDLLGSEATISALPFPPIHFASSSVDLEQPRLDSIPSSAILSHLSFVELADLESTPAAVELSAERDIGVVGTFLTRTGDALTSEMHLWTLKKEEVLLSEAFLQLESKPTDLAPPSNAFDWHASHTSRRTFEDSVVTSVEAMGPESLGLVLVGEVSQKWAEGVVGKFSVLKLSDLSAASNFNPTEVRTWPGKRSLPTSVASSSNSAVIASFDSSLYFHTHPTKAAPFSSSSSPTEWSSLCDELASSLGLSLYRNSDPSDLIRLISEGSKRRGDLSAVDAVLRKTWDVLVSQQGSSESLGDSDWLLPLMEIQRKLYESINDPRAKIAQEVLRFAASNAVFSKAFVEGRNGETDSFQIESIWNLITETSWVLNTIGDLLRTALLERGWNTWNKKETTEAPAPVARLLILLHPTTRDLLQSLLSQIQLFSAFVTSSLSSPIPGSPDAATQVRSVVSTEIAKNRLRDVVDRSGLDLVLLAEELEGLAGGMSNDLNRDELDPPLLSLSIPPLRVADMETLSSSVSRLPRKAASKVLLLLQPQGSQEGRRGGSGGALKRRKVEVVSLGRGAST